jgi:hypothetical protein
MGGKRDIRNGPTQAAVRRAIHHEGSLYPRTYEALTISITLPFSGVS